MDDWGADFVAFAREWLPARSAEILISLLRPGIHLSTMLEERPVVGHFGGAAQLPEELEWPSDDGRPMSLVATLDCRALASYEVDIALPEDGSLLFFAGWERYDANKVIYVPAGASTVTRSEGRVNPTVFLNARTVVTWPGRDHPALIEAFGDYETVRSELWDQAAEDLSGEFPEELAEELAEPFAEAITQFAEGCHQVGGHAFVLQSPFEAGAAAKAGAGWYDGESFYAEARQWVTLLQLDEDTDAGMIWGDGAYVIWGIRVDDLARRDFSKVYFDVQGH
jgi:uncharacterized protein YwqG